MFGGVVERIGRAADETAVARKVDDAALSTLQHVRHDGATCEVCGLDIDVEDAVEILRLGLDHRFREVDADVVDKDVDRPCKCEHSGDVVGDLCRIRRIDQRLDELRCGLLPRLDRLDIGCVHGRSLGDERRHDRSADALCTSEDDGVLALETMHCGPSIDQTMLRSFPSLAVSKRLTSNSLMSYASSRPRYRSRMISPVAGPIRKP